MLNFLNRRHHPTSTLKGTQQVARSFIFKRWKQVLEPVLAIPRLFVSPDEHRLLRAVW